MWGTLNVAEVHGKSSIYCTWVSVEMRAHRNADRRKAICFVCIINFPSSEVTTGDPVWWTCHKKAWSVCGQDGRVTMCICNVLLLNTVPVLHALCMFSFFYTGGKWTDVFRIQCSIKFLLPCPSRCDYISWHAHARIPWATSNLYFTSSCLFVCDFDYNLQPWQTWLTL